MAIFKIPGNANDHTEIYAHTHSLTYRNAVSKKEKTKRKDAKEKLLLVFVILHLSTVGIVGVTTSRLNLSFPSTIHWKIAFEWGLCWFYVFLVVLVIFCCFVSSYEFYKFLHTIVVDWSRFILFLYSSMPQQLRKKIEKRKDLSFIEPLAIVEKRWVENDWNSMKNGNKPAFKIAHPTRWQRNICWPVWSGKILNCEHLSFQLYPNRNNRLFYALSRIYSTFFILWIFFLFFFCRIFFCHLWQ